MRPYRDARQLTGAGHGRAPIARQRDPWYPDTPKAASSCYTCGRAFAPGTTRHRVWQFGQRREICDRCQT